MLCAMTIYYGSHDLRTKAEDVAIVVMKHAEAKKAGEESARLVQQWLGDFRDAEQIELCAAGHCVVQRAPEGTHIHAGLVNRTGLTCSSRQEARDGVERRVTVCMAIDDLFEDICRDTVLMLIAQAMGLGIWMAANRRYAANRKLWSERLNRATSTDAATGLLNRETFRHAIEHAAAQGQEGWLVFTGIDELKSINELHGSAIGDRVVLAVAERLRALDFALSLGRTGGDEFAFIVHGTGPTVLERALFRVRMAMTAPLEEQGLVLAISVSAGTAAIESHLSGPELMRRANVALRAAKKVGRDSQSIFNAAFDTELCKMHQLRLDLMGAVEKGQLELAYQPVVDARGRIVVAEALARWRHPLLGAVSPEVFIATAESSDLIHQLGIALLKKACADLVAARHRGLPLRRMAVNLSPAQLNHPDLAQIVFAVVREAGLQPSDIELELTESAAMSSRQESTRHLHELAEAGIAIAIDDFGTGYSSLSRLQTLPISKLKIDRSFVQACNSASGAVLLEAMIDLARRLGLSCVAEGVETEAQMNWLSGRGCQLFQGYLFGRPMPLDALIAMGAGTALERAPLRRHEALEL